MADLIKRLRMLAPPRPVERITLCPDDWAEVSQIIAEVERYQAIRSAIVGDDPRMVAAMEWTRADLCTSADAFDAKMDAARAAAAKVSGNAS